MSLSHMRALICGAPDPNYIDGSSIWSQSVTLLFEKLGFGTVDFLAKSKPTSSVIYAPLLDARGIEVIDGTLHFEVDGVCPRRLGFGQMAKCAIDMDQKKKYDVIIVRGVDIATSLMSVPETFSKVWLYLTDIPQKLEDFKAEELEVLEVMAKTSNRVLCQSEPFRKLWAQIVPMKYHDKLFVYGPLLPDIEDSNESMDKRTMRAVYAGKYKKEWRTLEMAQLWSQVMELTPDSELVMIGDKIHTDSLDENFADKMKRALESTPGVRWEGAQQRREVLKTLSTARLGLSWRDESMNDTLEYSTKLLEYGLSGCAAIVNRNRLHEDLLGEDYPLFANSASEFVEKVQLAFHDMEVCQLAADKLRTLAREHTFSKRVEIVKTWIQRDLSKPAPATAPEKCRVLVAGHDFKFFEKLAERLQSDGNFVLEYDRWKGHNSHDEAHSREMLRSSDIVFCEWCLGNLAWYSQNIGKNQILVARLHGQERNLPYLQDVNWANVDQVVFISSFIKELVLEKVAIPEDKLTVIPNFVDDGRFILRNKMGDARHCIGLVGSAPSLKRLDRAIDLLEALLQADERYRLRVKGKNPLDYPWLLNRQDEVDYYESIYERINCSPELRYRVIFDPPGDNVSEWFTMVGFILSCSDFESFHMAIAEGMLTGTYPIIWQRGGVNSMWPQKYIFSSTERAAMHIISLNEIDGTELRAEAIRRYGSRDVIENWSNLLSTRTLEQTV